MSSTHDNVHIVTSPTHFKEILSKDLTRVSLIYFWAPWAEPCKQMNDFVAKLAKNYSELLVLQVKHTLPLFRALPTDN